MGNHHVWALTDPHEQRAFTQAVLEDVQALERMFDGGMIEAGVRRIGAEQEYFLIRADGRVAPVASEVLARLGNLPFTTEIARYNLEANLPPDEWGGGCLRRLEQGLDEMLDHARTAAAASGAEVLLAGILPTLRPADLTIANITPAERYYALNDATVRLRGGGIPVRIKGIDEFYTVAENVMLESCNTSFQIHFQVGPEEFAKFYNLAQAVTGPLLAGAVNSPVLMERRLWEETRVALFKHSVDERSQTQMQRCRLSRVRFGERWVKSSPVELFREDIARFRAMLGTDHREHSLAMVARGEAPRLRALCLHNGTVWRWNRPCYGVHRGRPHLRIENRVLPAGPTVLDQVANAAFFYGLLAGLAEEYDDITRVLTFEKAKANFMAAARRGLRARLSWIGGKSGDAAQLILDELLPLARAGLAAGNVDAADIDRYLGVYEARVRLRRTGAQWALDSLEAMGDDSTPHARQAALTLGMLARQKGRTPVHEWTLASLDELPDWRHSYDRVGLFMTTDLFTVHPEDVIDLAASLMQWKHIRHVPVEDDDGRLVGIVSHRDLVGILTRALADGHGVPIPVGEIMGRELVTATPETSTLDALDLMREHSIGCLPVVEDERLVGIITERDLLEVARRVLGQQLGSIVKEPDTVHAAVCDPRPGRPSTGVPGAVRA